MAMLSPWGLYRRARPVQDPMRQPSMLVSRSAGRLYPVHIHRAFVDREGNGSTSISASHMHRIRNWQILPDESDGHDHQIVRIRTGSGI
jgi:hypothetical protein